MQKDSTQVSQAARKKNPLQNPLQNPQSWKGIVSFEHDEKYLADVSCTLVLVQ